MFARGYFPGRTGDLLIVPREGAILTRPEPDLPFMHGSPWPYDTEIPLLFVGPSVKAGVYATPARQQDVAPTLAAALGTHLPPGASGRVLPVLRARASPPRAVLLVVLDGMRRDYFDRYRAELPGLASLRSRGAWFARARIDVLPTNTAVGHATISTGADPAAHGITGNNLYDRATRRRHDVLGGWTPRDLIAPALADVWQLQTRGQAIVLAQGGSAQAVTSLAGHGACQAGGVATVLAGYDLRTGSWRTNPDCFRIPDYLQQFDARRLWPPDGTWMGHRIDTPAAVRRSGLFPTFEADVMAAMIEREPIGEDQVPDLILFNYKSADYVGHKHGPDSPELRATLAEIDRHLGRVLSAVERRVGKDYLLAITADHGMPAHRGQARPRLSPEVVDLVHARFDPDARGLVTYYEPENSQIFVDRDRLAALGVALPDLARFLESQPFVFAAFTLEEVRRRAASIYAR
jgi:hypothetical protein